MLNVKYLDRLYDDLLYLLQKKHVLRQEFLDKMYGEQRNSKKVKAILDYWDVFDDTSSNDSSVDGYDDDYNYKFIRDYFWDKIRNDIPDEDKLESLDTDNDGDIDKTDVSNIAKSITAYDVGRTFDGDYEDLDKVTKGTKSTEVTGNEKDL